MGKNKLIVHACVLMKIMKWITINNDLFNCFAFSPVVALAVQHERAPKMSMSGVTTSHHGLNYAANIYAARHPEALFPFQMHFATPAAFPLDNYYMPPPYYPHLTESLNLKLNQRKTSFQLRQVMNKRLVKC